MSFKPKILVVEDDTSMLRLLGEVLGQMGAEPRLLASSTEAAAVVDREKFDGVFLDWRMPDLDGVELARRIRQSKSNSEVPLVMLTGVTDPRGLKESFKVGINFYLQKPVSISQLRHLMNASRGQMLEERRRYQRAPVKLPMRCRWGNSQCNGSSLNLSASGVLLELPEFPPEGTRVVLQFELPGDSEAVELDGTVIRRAPGNAVGIRFHYHREDLRNRLKEFVEEALRRLDHRR